MEHKYRGVDYQVEFTDSSNENGYEQRHFILKDKDGKDCWHFTMKYKMKNGFPNIERIDNSSLPQTERDGILYKSLGI